MAATAHLWAVVLAGGDGLRMAAVTRDAHGVHVPKQFCHFDGEVSTLQRAWAHATSVVAPDHVVAVVQEGHRAWWQPELSACLPSNILCQPVNRGTALAVLHAVLHILEQDRDPILVILPSDQEVDDDSLWRGTLQRACKAAADYPEELMIVGVEPQADPHFGWVLPGEASADGTHTVLKFIEKPSAAQASSLARQGAMCSAFVFAASARALLQMFALHASGLVWEFEQATQSRGRSAARMLRAYAALPAVDFSRDILERALGEVRVVPCPACGWTDLGTPERLERWLATRRVQSRGDRYGCGLPQISATARPSTGLPMVRPSHSHAVAKVSSVRTLSPCAKVRS